ADYNARAYPDGLREIMDFIIRQGFAVATEELFERNWRNERVGCEMIRFFFLPPPKNLWVDFGWIARPRCVF
ncbi:MAG TPA: hypothetical protein VF278_12605, partial [Pirellulales bacterium]